MKTQYFETRKVSSEHVPSSVIESLENIVKKYNTRSHIMLT